MEDLIITINIFRDAVEAHCSKRISAEVSDMLTNLKSSLEDKRTYEVAYCILDDIRIILSDETEDENVTDFFAELEEEVNDLIG